MPSPAARTTPSATRESAHQFPAGRMCQCRPSPRAARPVPLRGRTGRALVPNWASGSACLVTEPYLGGGGSYHPQKEYLQRLERFCRQHDIVLILDEVQANFGRTGEMYAFTHYGIEPDIVVLGKGLGNGMPVDAAVGRADLFAAMHYGEGFGHLERQSVGLRRRVGHARRIRSPRRPRTRPAIGRHPGSRTGSPDRAGLRSPRSAAKGSSGASNARPSQAIRPSEVAVRCVAACYRGDAQGRAIHLLGPLAGKVLRVSPPLVMPLDEARTYLDAMYYILRDLGARLRSG